MILAPSRDLLVEPNATASYAGATPLPTRHRVARRMSFAVPAFALTVLGVWLGAGLTAGAHSPLRLVLLALLFGNLLYLALTGMARRARRVALRLLGGSRLAAPAPSGASRTAVLFPVYNEDPHAVFTAVEVMARDLVEQGVPRTDIFVLSDTRDPAIAAAEEAAFARLRRLFGERVCAIAAGWRTCRRKVGNIAEFCRSWSGAPTTTWWCWTPTA